MESGWKLDIYVIKSLKHIVTFIINVHWECIVKVFLFFRKNDMSSSFSIAGLIVA